MVFFAAIRQTREHEKANNIFIRVAIYGERGSSSVEKDDHLRAKLVSVQKLRAYARRGQERSSESLDIFR